jgi:gluconolactonase
MKGRRTVAIAVCVICICLKGASPAPASELPEPARVALTKVLEVPAYCEGVVFDREGRGYISWGKTITRFTLDGKSEVWAVTGEPNGHKILADGTHLVCDASHHAVLHLDANGKMLEPASKECAGKALRGPNDLTLDPSSGGFYFTDPGDSGKNNPIGTVHYVDASRKTHLVAQGLAYPNGIVLPEGGRRLLVAESQTNRVLEYPILSPGKAGPMKVFAELPSNPNGDFEENQPDGMCLDATGNLYVAHYGMQQVQVYSPEGKLRSRYPGGNKTTSNVAFGGPNHDQLFITGGIGGNSNPNPGGVFRLDLGVKGRVILPNRP